MDRNYEISECEGMYMLYIVDEDVWKTLTPEELETLRDDIDAVAFEPEDRFKQMDEERTAMRLKIEELEEKIADLEEEN